METDEEHQKNGNKALLFQWAISRSFDEIAQSVDETEFCRCLTILKTSPSIGQKLHKAMIEELRKSLNNDLKDILQDPGLQSGFSRISELIERTNATEHEAWRPPGNVLAHLLSLDAQIIAKQNQLLEDEVLIIEAENNKLVNNITEKRRKVCAMQESITQALKNSSDARDRLNKCIDHLETSINLLQEK